jgi:energy-coupling factor transport system permease protein
MIENITIGQYLPGNSLIHRMEARTKILATMIYMVSLFLINNLLGLGLAFLFTIILILLSELPIKFLLRGLKPLWIILIFTLILNLFFTPGEILAQVGPFRITSEGIWRALLMTSRIILLVLGTSILTLTTSPISLTDGIERLLSPGKKLGIPSHELAMMMSIALRFIPTLIEETTKIMKAQMARGADFESGNIFRRAKNMVPILVPLFIGAFRRADELAMAMEARCYRGGDNRTKMKETRVGLIDYLALLVIGIFCGVTIATRFLNNLI